MLENDRGFLGKARCVKEVGVGLIGAAVLGLPVWYLYTKELRKNAHDRDEKIMANLPHAFPLTTGIAQAFREGDLASGAIVAVAVAAIGGGVIFFIEHTFSPKDKIE